MLVIAGSSNAVNLTDGLDGLAIGCTIIAAGCADGADLCERARGLLGLPGAAADADGQSELTVFCGSMVGASIGFLWYNAHPAEVFMGDVGSLALGGAIGTVAVVIKQELLLPFIGGVFILEALSVMLQVGSYKLRGGKRIFKMAPLHHHFRADGVEREQGDCAVLDSGAGVCAVCADDVEAAVNDSVHCCRCCGLTAFRTGS